MASILRVIQGPEAGTVVPLEASENIIGKGTRAAIKLSSPGVSVEHAVITRSGDDYTIENLSSRGTFVNDTRLAGKARLRPRDRIRISGETVLRFESAGGDSILTEYRTPMVIAVAVLALLAVVLVFWNPLAETPPKKDWDKAYRTLHTYAEEEARAGRYPRSLPTLLAEARKHTAVGDYRVAQDMWFRVVLALQSVEDAEKFEGTPKNVHALEGLLVSKDPEPSLDPDTASRAMIQYAKRWQAHASRKAREKTGVFAE